MKKQNLIIIGGTAILSLIITSDSFTNFFIKEIIKTKKIKKILEKNEIKKLEIEETTGCIICGKYYIKNITIEKEKNFELKLKETFLEIPLINFLQKDFIIENLEIFGVEGKIYEEKNKPKEKKNTIEKKIIKKIKIFDSQIKYITQSKRMIEIKIDKLETTDMDLKNTFFSIGFLGNIMGSVDNGEIKIFKKDNKIVWKFDIPLKTITKFNKYFGKIGELNNDFIIIHFDILESNEGYKIEVDVKGILEKKSILNKLDENKYLTKLMENISDKIPSVLDENIKNNIYFTKLIENLNVEGIEENNFKNIQIGKLYFKINKKDLEDDSIVALRDSFKNDILDLIYCNFLNKLFEL
jgi:hypothetical protein